MANHATAEKSYTGLSRLKLFAALSRTPHGLIDMTTPMLGALLCLGAFPSIKVILLGLITVFAGYTAVYALNDLVDYGADRKKARMGLFDAPGSDLDAVLIRHPMAQGYLSFAEGMIWAMSWAAVAFFGAYQLNPFCVLIFVGACALEVIYCLMLRISHLRTLVSGVVKSAGTIAAVYAVDPDPSLGFVGLLFLWLALWEIGGQNIPNDWADAELDQRFGARTIPVALGAEASIRIIAGCLIASIILSALLFAVSPANFSGAHIAIAVGIGVCLLLVPVFELYRKPSPAKAMSVFNFSSYYPLSLFVLVVIGLAM